MTTPPTPAPAPLPLLATKLSIPPPRPHLVRRPRLSERLHAGRHLPLALLSAPAGFGKTTLLSAWLAESEQTTAWLSLDPSDNDIARFLFYLVAALQTLAAPVGAGVLAALHAPQLPPIEALLTSLLHDLTTHLPDPFLVVLDDYHLIEAPAVDHALAFLLAHRPPSLHLVIATRQDPSLPLARLRAGGQVSELRAADLRFTEAEAAAFLTEVMGLHLSAEDLGALERRTEGWIAGLHLAALSLQGQPDAHEATRFIAAFTGSHRYVMDYLVEEVLQRQPEGVQTFLLRTSILDRLCGPLCEAVVGRAGGDADYDDGNAAAATGLGSASESGPRVKSGLGSGQATLEYLDHANLFVVPLDQERRWYRYHHLFAELLRQRLHQRLASSSMASGRAGDAREVDRQVNELHRRASIWYEDNGLAIEAFRHAAAGHDVERAVRLLDGKGIPRHFRGAVTMILDWLASLPARELEARPVLTARYAGLLLVNGQTTGVEEKLQVAETGLVSALAGTEPDDKTRDVLGQIAAARATLALTRYQIEPMLVQSRRALEYLHPNSLSLRANAYWTMGFAYFLQGDHGAARQADVEAIRLSQAARDIFTTILATISLGNVQEVDNQLHLAAETYQRVLQLADDQPLQIVHEAHLGLARILYEWNDLEAAERHGGQSLHLARQYEHGIDRFVICEVFLARLKLAQGDVAGAATQLAQVHRTARQQGFVHRLPEIAVAQVLTLLHQGHLAAAAELAQTYDLPLSQTRVHLAQGDHAAALAVLAPWRAQVEARGWADERLKVLVLQALALQAQGDTEQAAGVLREALALAEPEGCVRLFVDEGPPMARLLSVAGTRGIPPDYIGKLLSAFDAEEQRREATSSQALAAPAVPDQPLIEPLSPRELEVLQFIAQGLSNQEIRARLFLALDTVKGHNRRIFDKLQVQRRTEAVARARELGLL